MRTEYVFFQASSLSSEFVSGEFVGRTGNWRGASELMIFM